MSDFIRPPENQSERIRFDQELCRIINSLMTYGDMHATNISQSVTVSATDAEYEITSGFTTGLLRNVTFGGGHYLQVSIPGRYLINWSLSVDTTGPGSELEGGVMVNGTPNTDGTSHTTISASDLAVAFGSTAILQLETGDQVSLFVTNHTNTNNIVVEHGSLTIKRVDS